jgi:hypothetical protein
MRFIYKVLCFFFVFLSLSFSHSLLAAQLRAILVGDTAAQDLKSSILLDLQAIEAHLHEAAKHTGLTPVIQRILGNEARSQNVLDALHRISLTSDDVVVFYFSGHGYRTPSKEKNPWPNLYFSTDQTGIDLFEIGSFLKNSPARLAVVLGDCCNNSLPNHVAPPVYKGKKTSANEETIRQNFYKLFVESRGLVLVASSKAGQSSWSINKSGSLYTNAYSETFKSLMRQASADMMNWQFLLDHAALKTQQLAKRNGISQDPVYVVLPN